MLDWLKCCYDFTSSQNMNVNHSLSNVFNVSVSRKTTVMHNSLRKSRIMLNKII